MPLFKSIFYRLHLHTVFQETLRYYKNRSERIYHWTGLSALGEVKSGKILARNRKEAENKLSAQTLIIKKLSAMSGWGQRLNANHITQMLQQLARIMQTGISLIQALQILITCQSHPKLGRILIKIQWELESGASFSEALHHHPRWFEPMVCAFIHLGERTGAVIQILEKIVMYQNKHYVLKQQIKTLLLYPIIVLIMAGIVSFYLLIHIVPQLQNFFLQAHQTLPWTTTWLIQCTQWLHDNGLFCTSINILFWGYIKIAYPYFSSLHKIKDYAVLHLPFIGDFYQAIYLARAFQVLSIAEQASLPLPDGLQWIAMVTHNFYYKRAFLYIRDALQQGESLRSALLETKFFPDVVVQIVSLGEESGKLSLLLDDLTHYYSQIVEDRLQRLSRSVEPALMIILGLIVGSLILSLYLPMIQLGAAL